MATDWAADVKKYAPNSDDGVIAGIVRYCGIALRNRDSSLVAFSDPKELDRVRTNFLKKKLALTQADSVLDAAIAKVGEIMKADRTKNRVTVYYLLADNFNQLGLFAAKAKAAAKISTRKAPAKPASAAALAGVAAAGAAASAKAPAKKKAAAAKSKPAAAKTATPAKKAAAPVAAPQGLIDKAAAAGSSAVGAGTAAAAGTVAAASAAAGSAASAVADAASDAAGAVAGAAGAAVAGAAGAAVAGAAGLAAGAADKAGSAVSGAVSQLTGSGSGSDDDSGLGWLWWVIGLALLLFAVWWLFLRGADGETAAPPAASEATAPASVPAEFAATPAEGTVEIPVGAGVTSELRGGKPVVKVYFNTGKTELAPAFTGAAGGLKAWLEANAGSSLAISGYSDPSGDAAANAELAKNRAQAVQAALVGAGIAEASAELVKPAETADAAVPPEAARRVEVVVR